MTVLRLSHLLTGLAFVICFVAGYMLGNLEENDNPLLEQICAGIDHVNRLQEQQVAQKHEAASEETRSQLKSLAEQCGSALSDGVEERD